MDIQYNKIYVPRNFRKTLLQTKEITQKEYVSQRELIKYANSRQAYEVLDEKNLHTHKGRKINWIHLSTKL